MQPVLIAYDEESTIMENEEGEAKVEGMQEVWWCHIIKVTNQLSAFSPPFPHS